MIWRIEMKAEDYQKLVGQNAKKSPIVKDCIFAFIIGGAICCVGQGFYSIYYDILNISFEDARAYTSISLVFLSALFTGIGWYDKLAKVGGAGTLVPITGFANAMVAPALEFKTEGYILGLGPKLFAIAGPVIVYGTAASFIYGVIYYIATLFLG